MANDLFVGLVAVAFCVLLFGIFTLPTKTTNTGDGIIFQWFMCIGIFFIGMITHFIQCSTTVNEGFLSTGLPSCPQFIPFSAIGGAIWCISNVLLVPLVNCIGIGLCMMIWGMSEMLIGWLTGRLGLFGVQKEPINDVYLNSIGVALALVSLLVLSMAQSSVADGSDKDTSSSSSSANKEDTNGNRSSIQSIKNRNSLDDPLLYASRFSVFTDYDNDDAQNGDNDDDDEENVLTEKASFPNTVVATTTTVASSSSLVPNYIRKLSRRTDSSIIDNNESFNKALINDPKVVVVVDRNNDHFEEHGWDITVFFTPQQKRILGIVGSLFAGLLSGSTFTPAQHVVDTMLNWRTTHSSSVPIDPSSGPFPGASTTLIDHLYSHFTGIFITSTAVTILYCIGTRNRPWVHKDLVFPSILAGLTWGLAMVSWFIANEKLSIVISFPLVTLGPGIVNMIIGTVVYKEVQGKRNILLLILSTFIYICAAVMISLSGPYS